MAAAGLGEEVLQENEVAEAKLQQLRRRRAQQASVRLKMTTSGATARDVQLVACELANRVCVTLDDDDGGNGGGDVGGGRGPEGMLRDGLGNKSSVAAAIASAGGVAAVTLLFRMFEASDLHLMVEALTLALALARGCAATPAADVSASETSSLAASQASGSADAWRAQMAEPSPLLPLLRTLYAPSVCRRVAEFAMEFPRSTKVQSLCCLLVGELGFTCGTPARLCFAECCEPIVAAVAGDLDENSAGESNGSTTCDGVGRGSSKAPSPKADSLSLEIPLNGSRMERVREAACKALATLAQEPGLARRMAATGAGQAVTRAMGADPRDQGVQLSCLESLTMLTEHNPGMWDGGARGDCGNNSYPPAVDEPCRRVVQSVQTFVTDPTVHRAASRALLAFLTCDSSGDAARSVSAAGGATALSRVLATSPTIGDVQLPAVLAIAELLEGCGQSGFATFVERKSSIAGTSSPVAPKVESELVSAAGCELLCKTAKTFPRDRTLRLGCLRAMAALCRGAGQGAVERLVGAGVCEQVSS